MGYSPAQSHDIKIGVAGPKTGPLAAGAAVTRWPPYRLWEKGINARGGFTIKGEKHKMKLIEYDDRSNPGETIKAIQRLATQDKADLIMAPYGIGFNLASAPIFAKLGYPQFAIAAVSDKIDEMTKKFPTMFFFLGDTASYAVSVAEILAKIRDASKINSRVAMVKLGDTFGIELANAARPVFKKSGFEIVYDKSYPLGTQDLTSVIKAGAGGIGNTAGFRDYLKRLKAGTGVDGDYWGTGVYGALTQVLTQSIETVGADRHAVLKYIKSRTFDTLMGKLDLRKQNAPVWWTVGQWQDGVFEGVKGYGTSGEKAVRMKSGW